MCSRSVVTLTMLGKRAAKALSMGFVIVADTMAIDFSFTDRYYHHASCIMQDTRLAQKHALCILFVCALPVKTRQHFSYPLQIPSLVACPLRPRRNVLAFQCSGSLWAHMHVSLCACQAAMFVLLFFSKRVTKSEGTVMRMSNGSLLVSLISCSVMPGEMALAISLACRHSILATF